MFDRFCPCCGRWLRGATVSSLGLFAFHVIDEPYGLVHESAPHSHVRREHAPDREVPTDRDIPGLYPVAVLTTTTTTTSPPAPSITASPFMPNDGNVVAWSDAAQEWVEIPDCGFSC